MLDSVIISDLHLGSSVSRSDNIRSLLFELRNKKISTNKLILNGDIFDCFNFKRLKQDHWKILSDIRKISIHTKVIWISGNHDGPSHIIGHLIGTEVVEEYTFDVNGKKVYVLHGDKFDSFITDHKILTEIATGIYYLIQKFDKDFYFSTLLKRKSKSFLRCTEKVKEKAFKYAEKNNIDIICCGHTHYAEKDRHKNIIYCNSGCWTDKHNHFLAIDLNGNVVLNEHIEEKNNGRKNSKTN